jgi:thymidylate synthase
MLKVVKADTIGVAWLKAMRIVMSEGEYFAQQGRDNIREIIPLAVSINNPSLPDNILDKFADKKSIEFMEKNFFHHDPIGNWGYSYADRLFDFHGKNQIDIIVDKLQSFRSCKSTTISLMECNDVSSHIPCLSTLDFKIRENHLMVSGFFRSQDIGKKMYADACCIYKIAIEMAQKLDCHSVQIFSLIASAHIYESDFENSVKIIKAFEAEQGDF